MLSRPCRRRGMSLIELLVAIGIMAALLALAVPALTGARSTASEAICLSNTRQLVQAGLNYAVDHQNIWVGWDPGIDRKQLLHPYLGQGFANEDVEGDDTVWHCPDNQRPRLEAGYGFNTNLNWERVTRVARPAQTVGICDAGVNDAGDPILATHVFPPSQPTFPNVGRPNPRHGDENVPRVAVAFMDGRAEAMPMEPPFYPTWASGRIGNGVTDRRDPDYGDEFWELR